MSDDRSDAERDESLADAFRSVARLLRQTSMESLAAWDITPSQSRALRVLTRDGPIRPSELSERLRIAPRSATEVVDDLAAKGLVAREPDPQDRRATLIGVTDHGTQVSRAIRDASGTEAERVFDKLSVADREHLARILATLRG